MNRRNMLGMMAGVAGTLGSGSTAMAARQQTSLSRGEKLARATTAASRVKTAFSKRELRGRIATLGVGGDWLDSELVSLGLHGSGIHLRQGKHGQLLTGPRLDLRIRAAFPELLEYMAPDLGVGAARNAAPRFNKSAIHDAPWTSVLIPNVALSTSYTQGNVGMYFDLSGVSSGWTISSVKNQIAANNTGVPNDPNWADITLTDVSDPYGQAAFGTGLVLRGHTEFDDIVWPSGGIGWVYSNAGSSSAYVGKLAVEIATPSTTDWIITVSYDHLRITY